MPRKHLRKSNHPYLFQFLSALTVFLFFANSKAPAQVAAKVVGEIENTYRTDKTSREGYSSNISEYLQNYQFGVEGYVLSKNFLTYYLGSSFRESSRRYDGTPWRSRSFDWYDFTGHFFRNRRVGFNLFARRTEIDIQTRGQTQKRYQDILGGECQVRTWWLPTTRFGYQTSRSSGAKQDYYRTNISTVYMSKASKLSQVESSFRDEQRITSGSDKTNRLQDVRLKGSTTIWDGSTTASTELNYTGNNAFKSVRANFRVISNFRERDRLYVLSSFNNVQNPGYVSFTNSFRGNYRRYITKSLNTVVNANLQRSMNQMPDNNQYTTNLETVDAGVEFLDNWGDSLNTFRRFGNALAKYQHSSEDGAGTGINGTGTFEWQRLFAPYAQLVQNYSLRTLYLQFPGMTRYWVMNSYLVNAIFRPHELVTFDNRLTITDYEGSFFERSLEERGGVTVYPARNLSANTSITVNMILQPRFEESVYWTNTVRWVPSRNIQWTTQSSWTFHRDTQIDFFWLDSTIDYRLRQVDFQLRFSNRIYQSRGNISILFNVSRTIGGGVGRR